MFIRNMSMAGIPELFTFDVMPGPVWQDHCEHPKDSYVGTVVDRLAPDFEEQGFDVYVFPCGSDALEHRQEVCIRHGNEPSDYYSVGPVIDLIIHCYHCHPSPISFYQKAARLILGRFSCEWKRDAVEHQDKLLGS